jgi:hypothetical protein
VRRGLGRYFSLYSASIARITDRTVVSLVISTARHSAGMVRTASYSTWGSNMPGEMSRRVCHDVLLPFFTT